ncbi:hypothetical protein ABEB36_005976 [Hypothenemus hampei]|uniref:Uncharacterized protein n=1 Tax=Hypothenemus hampei TaxID=57062 RepID=A0ABD1F020_HYPHA
MKRSKAEPNEKGKNVTTSHDKCEKKEILNLNINLGVVNYVGTCLFGKEHVINPKQKKGEETNYYLKSPTFKENPKWCNERIRHFKRNKMIKEHEKALLAGRNEKNHGRDVAFTVKPSETFDANLEYVTYRMPFFEESKREYSRRRVMRLKFNHYIRCLQAIDKLVNRLLLIAKNVRTLRNCGRASRNAGIEVSEYRTSKFCLICKKEMKLPHPPPGPPPRPPEDNNENRKKLRRHGFHRYAVCKTRHIA